jgi:beta-glucosidase
VVGVIFCGRPLALQAVEPYLDAILCAWHSGSATAAATVDILLGDVVPSGKTAVTFVKTTGHIPLYYNATASALPNNGYYGERPEECYLDIPGKPMYPFGYGLSYTDFSYSAITPDKTELELPALKAGEKFRFTVTVSNVGAYDGKETAQLYIRDKVASIMRPMRELKAFDKVLIPAHSSREITFELGYDDLGFYRENGEYVVERGLFEIYIGGNCLTDNTVTVQIK